jgi:outer membrane protein assembly factor BamB
VALGVCSIAASFPVGASSGSATPTRPVGFSTVAGADWPGYLFGSAHSSYNPGTTTVTPSNASTLRKAWRWLPPGAGTLGNTYLLASPTVVGGVVYIGADDGYFYAVSQTTHRPLWSAFLGKDTAKAQGQCGGGSLGIISTATVAADPASGQLRVFVNAPDGYLYALDATTGSVVWKGVVDVPSTTVNDYFSWGSPLVLNGKVYIGIASDCDLPLVQGGLVSFDLSTGVELARWHAVPDGQVGGTVWSSAVAAADGSIIVTTGNAPDPAVQPLYNESIVRLDPTTLQLLDAWQVPTAQQSGDGDFGASATTFTAVLGGVSTPMVGACNKNGVYYAFRQSGLAAGPVWQRTITIPYPTSGKYSAEECDAAAVWNGTDLIEVGGAPSTPADKPYSGSIQALDPATGGIVWKTHLHGTVVGSPSGATADVVAAPVYQSDTGQLGVYLVDAATGAQVGLIATPNGADFGQAVFVGNDLLVGSRPGLGLTDYAIFPTVTGVTPATLAAGARHSVTVGGTDFAAGAAIAVSGPSTGVTVVPGSVSVTSTTITATLAAGAGTTPGSYTLSVRNPDAARADCVSCLSVVAASTVTGLVPSTAVRGTTVPVTLTGSGFAAGATLAGPKGVFFTGVTVVDATTITATMRVTTTAPRRVGLPVVVTNAPVGGSSRASGSLLTIS